MKTYVEIRGEVNGNSTLRNALIRAGSKEERTATGYRIMFYSKVQALRALQEAHKKIREEMPKDAYLAYSRGYSLSYDASTAQVNDWIDKG